MGREQTERSGVGGKQAFDVIELVVGHVAEFATPVVEFEHPTALLAVRGDEDVVARIGDFADHTARRNPVGLFGHGGGQFVAECSVQGVPFSGRREVTGGFAAGVIKIEDDAFDGRTEFRQPPDSGHAGARCCGREKVVKAYAPGLHGGCSVLAKKFATMGTDRQSKGVEGHD